MRLDVLDLAVVEDDEGEYGDGQYAVESEGGAFKFGPESLSKHFLFLGGPGTGKTNGIFQFVRIIKDKIMTNDDVMVVFDTKGDYLSEFYDRTRGDIVIENSSSTPEVENPSGTYDHPVWNIFLDIGADGAEFLEQNANEIARTLYDDVVKTSKEGFFPRAASDITRAVMIALTRKSLTEKIKVSNKDLVDVLKNGTPAHIIALLDPYPDLRGVSQYIQIPTSAQTQGVMSTIQSLMNDVFGGSFGQAGSFSVRDLIKNKGGRTLFIEYDLRWGRILVPIYRILIDLAIKESLGRTAPRKGNVYFVIDEFALLPNLYHIDDGINFGRGQGAKFLIGTQNVSQVLESYGSGRGQSLLSNIGTLFCFRLNDEESKKLVAGRYGKYRTKVSMKSPIPSEPLFQQIVEADIIDSYVLSLLPTGRAIICASGRRPHQFQFKPYRGLGIDPTARTSALGNISQYPRT
jgi:type IV secretory pathway TraG/TraD family ATPase VirD4